MCSELGWTYTPLAFGSGEIWGMGTEAQDGLRQRLVILRRCQVQSSLRCLFKVVPRPYDVYNATLLIVCRANNNGIVQCKM